MAVQIRMMPTSVRSDQRLSSNTVKAVALLSNQLLIRRLK